MNIRVLGAHNCESQNSKLVSLLVDGTLAIDAGALTSSLSLQDQQKLEAILITHSHYDHLRDIPTIAMNLQLNGGDINIHSIPSVYDALSTYLLNNDLYPNFFERPPENPILKFNAIEPHKTEQIEGYSILAIPVIHSVPAVGYQVTSPEGKTIFYTGDTGPGLAGCWEHISPQLLITEVTAPDRYEEYAKRVGHLTPGLLKQELLSFQKLKGYLPQTVLVHMNPGEEKEIEAEIVVVAEALNSSIALAYEGMEIHL